MNFLNTTWYENDQTKVDRSFVQGRYAVETVVVGAGYAGLSLAKQLASHGREVIVLEANRIGGGASGRNGGFVNAGFAESLEAIYRRSGKATARELYARSRYGVQKVRNFVEALCPDAKHGEGCLTVSLFRNRELEDEQKMLAREFNHRVAAIGTKELRALLHTDRYTHAILDQESFQIDPYRFVTSLAAAVEASGAKVYENSRVISVNKASHGYQVCTPEAEISCQQLVMTSNVDHCRPDCRPYPPLQRAILPVSTYIAVTAPMTARSNPIATSHGVIDTRRAGNYYRVLPDNRILWGGQIKVGARLPSRLDAVMRRDMCSIYPELADCEFDFVWGGVMGYALHKMPLVGQYKNGIWYASAFGGHGINTATLAGEMVADAILKNDKSWQLFADFAPRWAGSFAGRLGVECSYRWMKIRDRMQAV
ncbi:MAG: FAD-binding oxidoreductase [Pseudomonadota bacterium]